METRKTFGFLNGIGAFLLWGFLPIYWKALKALPATEILAHRILWSFVFLFAIVLVQKRRTRLKAILKNSRQLAWTALAGLLITSNWLLYIWAVNTNHIVETGLGYFINPLVNIVLGVIFLKERLRIVQTFAVLLATLGIIQLTLEQHHLPWISLALAFTFGFYGLVRKVSKIDAIVGLTIETGFTMLPALIYLILLGSKGEGGLFHQGLKTDSLLIGAGIATSIPIICFVNAAQNLTLTTLGFLQYLAPSLQVLLGVFLYHEVMTHSMILAFACIWTALLLVSLESIYASTR